MSKYVVTATLKVYSTVEADNEDEATEKAQDSFNCGEHTVDDIEITLVEIEEEGN